MSGYPGAFNTFVPSFDASGHLAVAFSRNPKDFPLNKWITLTPVKKDQGYFLQVTAEEAARVLQADLADFIWPDGNDSPTGLWGNESFTFTPFNTVRHQYAFRIGYKAEQQADWKILAMYAAFKAQQAMTARAVSTINVALNTANYGTHTGTAAALGGGFLSAGTGTGSGGTGAPYIKKALLAAAQQINIDTNGAVKFADLMLVISPVLAAAMAESGELIDYLKQSPVAMAQIRGDAPNYNAMWSLPERLYGVNLIVDDTVRVTSRKGAASRAANYAFVGSDGVAGNTALLCARPGSLVSEAAGPSFGTVHIFVYEDMTVEQRDDPNNRRIEGRVVDDFGAFVVAPATGYVITHCLS